MLPPFGRPLKVPETGLKPVLFTSVSTAPGAGAKPRPMVSVRPLALKLSTVTGTSVSALKVAVFGVVKVMSAPANTPCGQLATSRK